MTAMPTRAGAANTAPDPLAIIEWLSGDECHELDDAGLIAELGRRLRKAGLPIDRLTLHLLWKFMTAKSRSRLRAASSAARSKR